MADILVIDDEESICGLLSIAFGKEGHAVTCATTLADGISKAEHGAFDVVFLDVNFPEGSGLDALPQIRNVQSSPEVVIMTGQGDPDGAELAVKSGAWDYVQKTSSIQAMRLPLHRALQYRQAMHASSLPLALDANGIVGESRAIKASFHLLAQAANSTANVLITGESGTGKELFARAIHQNSPRAAKNFVVVDCAALPETLMTSTLFGHEKGAFTGADRSQIGLVKHADGGTLFLDEVGELPLFEQKAFLRVLQEHSYLSVGGIQEVKSDFRLVCATNKDLDEMVQKGLFREDLLFRLRSLTIMLPPLREREGDAMTIAINHTASVCDQYKLELKGFSPEFFEVITAKYDWPGNVRELLQAVEAAVSAANDEPILFPHHLPTRIRAKLTRASIGAAITSQTKRQEIDTRTASTEKPFVLWKEYRARAVAKAEKAYLEELLACSNGDLDEASKLSGLSRPRLYALMQKHKMSRHK